MTKRNRFEKRRGLSRVLTELIFLLLVSTAAIGAFSLYNSYSYNMTGTTKVIIEQADIIASQNKTYIVVKNVGTTNVGQINATIGTQVNSTVISLPPGRESTLIYNMERVVAGRQYTIVLTVFTPEREGISTTTYTTTALP
jgi:hypothetical protein